MSRPLLSILIATRNRQETASVVIAEILSLNLPDLELVVSDTSDEQNLLELVKEKTDSSNLIYQHTPKALSMSDNYSNAIKMSSGEYICMIGDDDFILPNIIDVAKYAKNNDLKSVTQNTSCSFVWDNFDSGRLHGNTLINGKVSLKKTKHALNWILFKGGMMDEAAPRLYHGVVNRSVFDELMQNKGRYFFGCSPDISATVSICCLTDTYGYSSRQFTVPGASKKSNSSSGLKRYAPHNNTNEHVTLHESEQWPLIIPPLMCAETGWPEATYKTLNELNTVKSKKINLVYSYLLMYLKYKTQYQYITPSLLAYIREMSMFQMVSIPINLVLSMSLIVLRRLSRVFLIGSISQKIPPSISKIQSVILSMN